MRNRRRMRWLSLGLALTFAGCCARHPMGIALRGKTRLQAERDLYCGLRGNKSLALAGDPEGLFVVGYSYQAESPEAAVVAALEDCRKRAQDRRVPGPCRTIASDSAVQEASGGRPPCLVDTSR